LGLKILQDKKLRKKPKGLIDKHLSPTPRVELGQALAKKHVASAMIDISDGILNDTNHILEESKVGARIWEDRIPLSSLYQKWIRASSKAPYQLALSGGEDYELLFTASPEKRAKVSSLARSLNIPLTRVGEILPEKEGLHFIGKGGKEIKLHRLGFDHFK